MRKAVLLADEKQDTPEEGETIEVDFHGGGALRAIGMHYRDPMRMIKEIFQNLADKRAKRAVIKIDRNKRRISGYDDGEGASLQEMKRKFENFCTSDKRNDPEAIGYFGIALSGGIVLGAKCKIVTRHILDGREPYREYIMTREMWEQSKPALSVIQKDPHFSHGEWTTSVIIDKVEDAKFRQLSDPERIAEEIADEFNETILRKQIRCEIIVIDQHKLQKSCFVVAREFEGKREKPIDIATTLGSVTFEMWQTVKPVRNPKVFVLYKGKSRFPLKNLKELWASVEDALGSGFLQGKIHLHFGTLLENREELVCDDSYYIFAEAVERFCEEYARPLVEGLESERIMEHNAEILRQSVSTFEEFLSRMPDLMPEELKGFVSQGHKNWELGENAEHPFRTTLEEAKKMRAWKKERESGKKRNEYDKLHTGVEDKKGTRRRIIKGQRGLMIVQEEAAPESGMDWRSRFSDGVIAINISHEDWRLVTANRSKVMVQKAVLYSHLQIMKELTCLSLEALQAREFHRNFERVLMPYFRAFL